MLLTASLKNNRNMQTHPHTQSSSVSQYSPSSEIT